MDRPTAEAQIVAHIAHGGYWDRGGLIRGGVMKCSEPHFEAVQPLPVIARDGRRG